MAAVERPKVFFAYPGRSPLLAETMRSAAKALDRRSIAETTTWEELDVNGRSIVAKILEAIDQAKVVVAEVTDHNSNVLFEVGYAIATGKEVFLALDTSNSTAHRRWRELGVLSSVGYSPYDGSSEALVAQFAKSEPQNRTESLWEELLVSGGAGPRKSRSLFYVPLGSRIDAGKAVDRSLMARKDLSVVSADEEEQGLAPLSWYAVQIYQSNAALVHLRGPQRSRSDLHNARASLFAGIAHGLRLPTLLIAEETFEPPLDYADLLYRYPTAKMLRTKVEEWLNHMPGQSDSKAIGRKQLSAELPFRRFGEYVAENEQDELLDYFVETGEYLRVLDSQSSVFVGRKGTGKTANMLSAADTLSRDRRNLVTVVKPSGYEFEGLLTVFKRIDSRDKSDYLVDGLWRYMLLLEIASAAVREAEGRPAGISSGSAMDALRAYLGRFPGAHETNFAVRLERIVDDLMSVIDEMPERTEDSQAWLSRRLHADSIAELRKLTGEALHDRQRVAVLIDNLDKAWERTANRVEQARIILGLLSAVGRLEKDFRRDDSWRNSVNVTLAVFLRSDIFDEVKKQAREPDKILTLQVAWNDAELLARVIEDRYVAQHEGSEPDVLWKEFFAISVNGRPTRDYLLWRTLPRPRDLVYFCNSCVLYAINRRHSTIEEDDVKLAEQDYSQFAFDALRVEGSTTDELDDILIGFAGCPPHMRFSEVEDLIHSVSASADGGELIRRLIKANFLGLEVAAGTIDYPRSEQEEKVAVARASRFGGGDLVNATLWVHPAFRPYLGIDD